MFAPTAGAAAARAGRAGDMEKGPFSVEWLAQSSRGGGAREMPGECGPCPPGAPARRARRFRCPRAGHGRLRVTGNREGSPDGSPLQTPPSVPAESPRDREAAERRSPGHGAGSESSGRSRTKFSAAQLQELERSFREQRYIGAGEKRRLAAVLNLSQSQVSAPGLRPSPAGLAHTRGTGTGTGTAPAGLAARQPRPAGSERGLGKPTARPHMALLPGTRHKWKMVNASSKGGTTLGVKVLLPPPEPEFTSLLWLCISLTGALQDF